MKYWKYFQIRNPDGDLLTCKKLYAIALTKADKELFERYRKMDMFICEKVTTEKPEKDESVNFGLFRLKLTSFHSVNEFGLHTKINIQTTCIEEENTVFYYDRLEEKLLNMKLPSPNIFNKKYRKYLNILGYDTTYSCANELDYLSNVKQSKLSLKTNVDEFKVFMKLYGYTMKGCE